MMRSFFVFFVFTTILFPQVNFEDYFLDKTLRFDYYHTGNRESDSYSFDEMNEEPYWGGSKVNLIDEFDYGKYIFEVHDAASNEIIYSRTYSTLFNEWQTTEEARLTTKSFSETVVFPYPKNLVKLVLYGRDEKNKPVKKFEYDIDPSNYFIKSDRSIKYKSFDVIISGETSKKVDIVIIPDGYTTEQMDKFKDDCNRFAGYLFSSSPLRENKDKFNIRGIIAPSEDSGIDIPAEDIWKNTVVNTSFYSLDLERYVMTSANKELRNIASYAPYDQIYILANTNKYGGGSIYNHYSVCVSDNENSEFIFTHEFGHGFASLGDEYYTSDVTYEDFYPTDVEPLDPNLTTLVNFPSKWAELVESGTPIPTPDTDEYANKVGAFEGGGYVAKGVFRPFHDCTMKSIVIDKFCPVCKSAIQQMIDFYSE